MCMCTGNESSARLSACLLDPIEHDKKREAEKTVYCERKRKINCYGKSMLMQKKIREREKGKQIINCTMLLLLLHLSPEKLYLLLWVLFRARALAFVPSLPSFDTHSVSIFSCDPTLPISVARFSCCSLGCSLSRSCAKFYICMQLKFDDSSCGNPFGAKWVKRNKKCSFKRPNKWISERAEFFILMSHFND